MPRIIDLNETFVRPDWLRPTISRSTFGNRQRPMTRHIYRISPGTGRHIDPVRPSRHDTDRSAQDSAIIFMKNILDNVITPIIIDHLMKDLIPDQDFVRPGSRMVELDKFKIKIKRDHDDVCLARGFYFRSKRSRRKKAFLAWQSGSGEMYIYRERKKSAGYRNKVWEHMIVTPKYNANDLIDAARSNPDDMSHVRPKSNDLQRSLVSRKREMIALGPALMSEVLGGDVRCRGFYPFKTDWEIGCKAPFIIVSEDKNTGMPVGLHNQAQIMMCGVDDITLETNEGEFVGERSVQFLRKENDIMRLQFTDEEEQQDADVIQLIENILAHTDISYNSIILTDALFHHVNEAIINATVLTQNIPISLMLTIARDDRKSVTNLYRVASSGNTERLGPFGCDEDGKKNPSVLHRLAEWAVDELMRESTEKRFMKIGHTEWSFDDGAYVNIDAYGNRWTVVFSISKTAIFGKLAVHQFQATEASMVARFDPITMLPVVRSGKLIGPP